jgi:hypothetical protein
VLIYGLPLLLGFFLISATLFGLPSDESNFTVDEYGKKHYILIPEKNQSSFLEELSAIVSGRYGSEHKIFDYNYLIDSQSLLLLPFVSDLFSFEQEQDSTTIAVNSIVDFEFISSFNIIEDDSDLTALGNSKEQETAIDTSISIERVKTSVDYNFKQMQIGGH